MRPTGRATSSIGSSKAARKGLSSSSRRFSSAYPRTAGHWRSPSLHPVREVRRSEVPRCRARQGPACSAAVRRESPRQVAGFCVMHLLPGCWSCFRAAHPRSHGRGHRSAHRTFYPSHPGAHRRRPGAPSSRRPETFATRNGRRTWSVPASGMNRISTVSTMTPRFGAPTSFNSSRSPAHRIAAQRCSPWALQL